MSDKASEHRDVAVGDAETTTDDSRNVGSKSDGPDLDAVRADIKKIVNQALSTSPLQSYADEHDAILKGAEPELDDLIISSVRLYRSAQQQAHLDESDRSHILPRIAAFRMLRFIIWILTAVSVLVAALAVLNSLPWTSAVIREIYSSPLATSVVPGLSMLESQLGLPLALGALFIFVSLVFVRFYIAGRISALRQILAASSQRRDDARTEYWSALETAIRRSLNAALSRVLDSSDIVPIRVGSLQLVETRGSEVVVSRAVQRVLDFIRSHDASAIGIAGQRGIGKTTILRHLADRTAEAGGLAITVTVPVLYEPEAMVRRIYGEFLRQTTSQFPSSVRGTSSSRESQAFLAIVAVGTGSSMLGFALLSGVTLPELPSDPRQRIGVLLLLTGLFLMFTAISVRWLAKDHLPAPPSHHNQKENLSAVLAEGSAMLTWSEERTSSREAAVEIPNKLLSAKLGSNVKRTERPIGRPELAQHFRHTISKYVNITGSKIVICVDELDKIEHSEGALQLVNELKDLMHVPGTHFLLSVSEDALRAFSLRGIRIRDVVDSTFDEVFEAEGLTAAESHQVIVQRAPEFPPPLTRFCHAWSLGVPRDLLRAARHCIAVGADEANARRQLGALVQEVVVSGVRNAVVAQASQGRETGLSDVESKVLQSHLQAGDVSKIYDLLVTHRENSRSDFWLPLLGYLKYALVVIENFGVARKYWEWRTLNAQGHLDELADRLVAQERQARLLG